MKADPFGSAFFSPALAVGLTSWHLVAKILYISIILIGELFCYILLLELYLAMALGTLLATPRKQHTVSHGWLNSGHAQKHTAKFIADRAKNGIKLK
jgi:hypothetical protein